MENRLNEFIFKVSEDLGAYELVWLLRSLLRQLKLLKRDNFQIHVHQRTAKNFFSYLSIAYSDGEPNMSQLGHIDYETDTLNPVGRWEGVPFYVDNKIAPSTYRVVYKTAS